MIKEALEYLFANWKQPPDQIVVAERDFLRNPDSHWQEIKHRRVSRAKFINENGKAHQLGTTTALIDFILTHAKSSVQVIVGHDGIKAYFGLDEEIDVDDNRCIDYVSVPFKHPAIKHEFGYVGFMDFLDQHGQRIHESDALRTTLRTFKSVDMSSIKIKEVGAIITVETGASKGLEGSTTTIPKELVIDMPTGTREFLIPNTYLLRIVAGSTDTQFVLTKKEHDGSWDTLLDLAFYKLKKGLSQDILILEGV